MADRELWGAPHHDTAATIRIIVPWPPRELFPNARVHHMTLHRARKPYRAAAQHLAQEALRNHGLPGGEATWPGKDRIPITVTVFPPHNRHDDDNRYAATKAARDGIADGLEVNDRRFKVEFRTGGILRGGAVVVDVAVGAAGMAVEREEAAGVLTSIPEWLERPSEPL